MQMQMQMTYYHDLNFLFVLAHQLRFDEENNVCCGWKWKSGTNGMHGFYGCVFDVIAYVWMLIKWLTLYL